jgi:anti-sigma-K factor RskA
MKTHEQFADDLALYALGELTGREREELEQHVENCAACRRELQTLRGDLGLLGLTSSGPQPPARSKERLMRAIAAEPRAALESRAPGPRGFWAALIPALAALALLLVTVGLLQVNSRLKSQMAELSSRNQRQNTELDRANEELRLLSSGDAIHVSLKPQNMPMQPSGTAIFSLSQKRMMFMASNLAPVPAGKAYELWIIPMAGAPIPAGVFKPDNHGNAMMMDHEMPEGVEAKAFAVTVENESGSERPTSAILLSGAVS